MPEPSIDSPETLGALRGCAMRYRRPGFEIDELVSVGILKLLRTDWRHDPARGDWNGYVRWVASSAMIHWQSRKMHRMRCVSHIDDFDIPVRGDTEDVPDWMVELFARMGDVQARIVVLMAGLDGGPPRSAREVAHIMGRDYRNIVSQYRGAIEKLRRLMPPERLRA